MRVRTTMTSASSVLAGALLLATACSGGSGSAEASGTTEQEAVDPVELFCTGAQQLYDQFVAAGASDPTSPAMQEVYAGAQQITAPEEIAADWQLILESLEPLMTGQVDINDPAALQELNEQAAANAPAYGRVGTYVNEHCQIAPATTDTTPVATDDTVATEDTVATDAPVSTEDTTPEDTTVTDDTVAEPAP